MLEQNLKEDELFSTFPEVFKQLEKELFERWFKWDVERKEFLTKELHELGYKVFINRYKHSNYNLVKYTTVEQLRADNEKQAHAFLIDLYRRVNAITGKLPTILMSVYMDQPLMVSLLAKQAKQRLKLSLLVVIIFKENIIECLYTLFNHISTDTKI